MVGVGGSSPLVSTIFTSFMKPINSIDINADLGEFQNEKQLTNELIILNYISSCSIACGGHIGDFNSIKIIIEACKEKNISIGPHPSYPDKKGFGRRKIDIDLFDLEESITNQIQSFLTIAESLSMPVRHIKLHGKLYHDVAWEEKLGSFFLEIIGEFRENFSVIGPAKSPLESMTKKVGISFIPEAFIDRRYRDNCSLVERNQEGSLLDSVEDQTDQARNIIVERKVLTNNNKMIDIKAETICIHGDSPSAVQAVRSVCNMLRKENINIQPHS